MEDHVRIILKIKNILKGLFQRDNELLKPLETIPYFSVRTENLTIGCSEMKVTQNLA